MNPQDFSVVCCTSALQLDFADIESHPENPDEPTPPLPREIATVKVGRLARIPASEIQRIIESGLRPAREVLP